MACRDVQHGRLATYGLGSECEELPGFVVLNGGLIPPGGLDCFGNGFLPASYQGSVLRPSGQALANAVPIEPKSELQQSKLALLRKLDQTTTARQGAHDELESAIKNYETAFRMQSAIPKLCDLSDETQQTLDAYGVTNSPDVTQTFCTRMPACQKVG